MSECRRGLAGATGRVPACRHAAPIGWSDAIEDAGIRVAAWLNRFTPISNAGPGSSSSGCAHASFSACRTATALSAAPFEEMGGYAHLPLAEDVDFV